MGFQFVGESVAVEEHKDKNKKHSRCVDFLGTTSSMQSTLVSTYKACLLEIWLGPTDTGRSSIFV